LATRLSVPIDFLPEHSVIRFPRDKSLCTAGPLRYAARSRAWARILVQCAAIGSREPIQAILAPGIQAVGNQSSLPIRRKNLDSSGGTNSRPFCGPVARRPDRRRRSKLSVTMRGRTQIGMQRPCSQTLRELFFFRLNKPRSSCQVRRKQTKEKKRKITKKKRGREKYRSGYCACPKD